MGPSLSPSISDGICTTPVKMHLAKSQAIFRSQAPSQRGDDKWLLSLETHLVICQHTFLPFPGPGGMFLEGWLMSGPRGGRESVRVSMGKIQACLDLAKRGMAHIRVTRCLNLPRTKGFPGTSAFSVKLESLWQTKTNGSPWPMMAKALRLSTHFNNKNSHPSLDQGLARFNADVPLVRASLWVSSR